jgi:hypothetical protein
MLGEAFSSRELTSRIARPSGLELVQPLDTRLSPQTWRAAGDPGVRILVKTGRSWLTSVCLVLIKPS